MDYCELFFLVGKRKDFRMLVMDFPNKAFYVFDIDWQLEFIDIFHVAKASEIALIIRES